MFHVFQVVFEGVRGTNYRGDIAIDDVSFTAGPCPSSGMKTITIHYESPCRIEVSHPRGRNFNHGQGLHGLAHDGLFFFHTFPRCLVRT